MSAEADTRDFIAALAVVVGSGEPVELRETHISWVLLTREFAYKIKKPVRFGFVDFSTLAARRQSCLEELRLNRRLTAGIYLEVLEIYGSAKAPSLAAAGPVIEYAVKMRRFPPDAVLGETAFSLTSDEIDELALLIGRFHASLEPATEGQPWGTPERIWAPVSESLGELRRLQRAVSGDLVQAAAESLNTTYHRLRPVFEERRRTGAVRECHGDLHLGNLVRLGGRIVPFDALEFDPALRWIDVLDEVAFLMMDLDTRGERALAFRFLSRYLDVTGDHHGVRVVPFYVACRALVRAKVSVLGPDGHSPAARDRARQLLDYAATPLPGMPSALVLMCGISGSGKSWLANRIGAATPALHVRSDVERRRLFSAGVASRRDGKIGAGIYSAAASAVTYARLQSIAHSALDAGMTVIVDATSLRREHRAPFVASARDAGCPSVILWCLADDGAIAERIERRQALGLDPSEADVEVATSQRSQLEPPQVGEADLLCVVNTGDERTVRETLVAVEGLIRQSRSVPPSGNASSH